MVFSVWRIILYTTQILDFKFWMLVKQRSKGLVTFITTEKAIISISSIAIIAMFAASYSV